MKTAKALLAALLILGLACPALAGWQITESADGETSKLFFQQGQVREESPESISIMDLNQSRLTLINPANKTYWSGPFSEMLKMRDQAMSQMREQIKQLPPEQRAAAMAAMPGVMGKSGQPRPKVLVKKTGQSETIAGFPAQKHEIWVNGSLREELWIAPKITLTQELDPKKLKEAMASFAMAGDEDAYELDSAVQELWSQGYPVKVVTRQQGETTVRQVTSAQAGKLSAELFKVPQGYRQAQLQEMLQ